MVYNLKTKAYYRALFKNESDRLFNAAWNQYVKYLRGSIDDPIDDDEVISWLDQIISEKVNNPKSIFYIYG
jgi:hypothetical protein